MVACNHSVSDAALGIQWHAIAMFGPSFFTGVLIAGFGAERVVATGLTLLVAGALVGFSGITITHYWTALVLLGVGWNFAFVGSTSIVTDCHRPEERNKLQALNDFLVFGSMVIGSFLSGFQLAHFGWEVINEVAIAVLLSAAILLGWVRNKTRRQSPA
jgi:MFS family permease